MGCKVGSLDVTDIRAASAEVDDVYKDGVRLWHRVLPSREGIWHCLFIDVIDGKTEEFDMTWDASISKFVGTHGLYEYTFYFSDNRWYLYKSSVINIGIANGTRKDTFLTMYAAGGLSYHLTWRAS